MRFGHVENLLGILHRNQLPDFDGGVRHAAQ